MNSIGFLLNSSARLIKRKMDKFLEEDNVTTAQWAVIKVLESNGTSSPAKIAEILNSDRATIGSVIDRLIEKGLVEKNLDQNDRRSFAISLTTEGLKMVPKIEGFTKEINSTALNGVNDSEIEIFYRIVSKIIDNLSKDGGKIDEE